MSRRTTTAKPAAPTPEPEQNLGAPDARSVLQILMLHAAAHLTPAELEHVGRVDECALQMASHAGTVAMGTACLVMGDADGDVGSFQSADQVSSFMLLYSDVCTTIAGLIEVSGLARDHQQTRGAA